MTLSIWRYSHLALAVSSFVFVLLASVTGIILAVEPIQQQLKPYAVEENVTVGETIEALREEYLEVLFVEVDHNGFVSASVITEEGDSETFYINPATGEKVGELLEQHPIFSFATNLHRSLFLKSVGRFFVGLGSFLLFLIAVTGILLILKRQGSFKKFFGKISKESLTQHYHVYLGRLFLIPILIITITGVYLSLEKFEVFPNTTSEHSVDFESIRTAPKLSLDEIAIFKNTAIAEVKRIEFPFSPDPEDYFILQLKDRELYVNQVTGDILSEVEYPMVKLFSNWSLKWHTGRGSILWSIFLGLASISILYFIYSGFVMWWRRRKISAKRANTVSKDDAEIVLLVGSETGNTYQFAVRFQEALLALNQKVYIDQMNRYQMFPKLKHLVILTSTYGDGEAPANAGKFAALVEKLQPEQKVKFSVVGFGSMAYEHYCGYAVEVDRLLRKHPAYSRLLPLEKINNQSFSDFKNWGKRWGVQLNLNPSIQPPERLESKEELFGFEVIERTELNIDNTFLLLLRPTTDLSFQSGDLLAVKPKGETVARLYSIGKVDGDIVLSIKKHEFGICSQYFSQLQKGDSVKGAIRKNERFHFPKEKRRVLLISNGTGIGPYLGMIAEADHHTEVELFWGGRHKNSFDLYRPYLESLQQKDCKIVHIALSRVSEKAKYVQQILQEKQAVVEEVLYSGGAIMICGSVTMQKGVLQVLRKSLKSSNCTLQQLENEGRLLMDCY